MTEKKSPINEDIRKNIANNVATESLEPDATAAQDADQNVSVQALQTQIQTLEASVEEYKDKYIRAVAETENIRRRAQKEQEDAAKFGATLLAKDIILFVDNLERAAQCCPKCESNTEIATFLEGIHIILKDILVSLEKHGIKKIDSNGQLFDPAFHQAVAEVEAEGKEAGTVIETLQTGYTLNGRLIRAAAVTVAK